MRLDDSVFESITKALGAIPDSSEPLRRRQSQRFHVDREVSIRPFGAANANSRSVTLVNISAGGVCIVDRVPVSTGDRFMATLPQPGGGSINVLCTARQSRLTPTRAYKVGAEFTSEVENDVRLVRGREPENAVRTSVPDPDDATTALYQGAVIRLSGREMQVNVRKFADGIFQVSSKESVLPGQQVIIEFQFQDRRQAWQCTVSETRDLPRGLYSIALHNDGPAEVAADDEKRTSWIKRLFRRS